jgi:hypothetical protein
MHQRRPDGDAVGAGRSDGMDVDWAAHPEADDDRDRRGGLHVADQPTDRARKRRTGTGDADE